MDAEIKEPTLVEDTISTIEQKYTKTNKTYLLVVFTSGLRASAWDQQALWPILKTAQTNNVRMQIWYTRNNMGYNTIQNLELMGGTQTPSTPENPGTGGKHFIGGVNGQQGTGDAKSPAQTVQQGTSATKPPAPTVQQTPTASGLTISDRVQLCLATAMVAWGGTMVKNESEYFVWLRKLEQACTGQESVLPGYEQPDGPAYQGPEYQDGA